ncbi:MAG: hypothetical protein JWM19_2255 [Actinomycetia bacterium]|nr:hypothetical protein [Actinomycetes bacterium]
MLSARVVGLQGQHVAAVQIGEAADALQFLGLPGHADRVLRLGQRLLAVDIAAGDLYQAVGAVGDEQVLPWPSWANDTMSSGWFTAPTSATVRPTALAPCVRPASGKCTTGVHV